MQFSVRDRAKPVLKWAGGKASLLPQFIPLFPKNFARYIEPFLGGGAVFFALNKDKNIPAHINEFNSDIFNMYCVIRDFPEEFMSVLDSFKQHYSEDFFYQLRSQSPAGLVERAARTLFLNKTGFNGLYRLNLKGEFNVPFGHRLQCPALFDRENIQNVAHRLSRTTLTNLDFGAVLAQGGPGDFIYCDPPYEPISQTSSFNSYNGGGFPLKEQERLFHMCVGALERGATVAISNSVSPAILDLYKEYKVHRILAKRSINSKGNRRGKIEEILVLM